MIQYLMEHPEIVTTITTVVSMLWAAVEHFRKGQFAESARNAKRALAVTVSAIEEHASNSEAARTVKAIKETTRELSVAFDTENEIHRAAKAVEDDPTFETRAHSVTSVPVTVRARAKRAKAPAARVTDAITALGD